MRKHYVGMDVHQASTSIAVMNSQGKLISESLIETKAQKIVDFLKGLSGEVLVTFEEGKQAAWLYDLIRPHVSERRKPLNCGFEDRPARLTLTLYRF